MSCGGAHARPRSDAHMVATSSRIFKRIMPFFRTHSPNRATPTARELDSAQVAPACLHPPPRETTCETRPARHDLENTTDILAPQITRSGLAAPPDPRAEHVHSPLLWSSNIFVRCPPARRQAGGQRTSTALEASRGAASSAPRKSRARRARLLPARCRCAATVDPPRLSSTSGQPFSPPATVPPHWPPPPRAAPRPRKVGRVQQEYGAWHRSACDHLPDPT
jgi:hypothetical protein